MVDVRVEVESNWEVQEGLLHDCIRVRSSNGDEAQNDGTLNSTASPLILVRPDDSRPCEITVKFQGNLCFVQSLSVLSTARTCEIYSQNDISCDAEYVCTLRADVHKSGDNFSNVDTHSKKLIMGAVASSQGHVEINERPSDNHSEEGNQVQDALESTDPLKMDSCNSRQIILNGTKSESLLGSCVKNSNQKSLSLVAGQAHCSSGITVESTPNEETHGSTHESDYKNRDQLDFVDPFVESDCSAHSLESSESCPVTKTHNTAGLYYKGKIQVANPVPWASLKVRLLSLSDKSCVNLAKVSIHATAGPLFPSTMDSSDSPAHPQHYDRNIGSSLLALLVPGMLKVVRALPDVHVDSHTHDSQMGTKFQDNKFASKMDGLPSQPFTSNIMSMMGQSSRKRHDRQTDVLENSSPCLQQSSSSCMKVPNMWDLEINAEAYAKTLEINHDSVGPSTDDHKQFQNSVQSVNKMNSSFITQEGPSFEKRLQENDMQVVATTGAYDESMCYGERNEKSSTVPETDVKYSRCGSQLEIAMNGLKTELFTRLDRLETMCLRMESYLHCAFQSFDVRLQALESYNKRMSLRESCPSILPMIHTKASGDASSKQQEIEAFDEIVECSSSYVSHTLDMHTSDTSHTSDYLIQPICSASQSFCASSSTCSLNNISTTCVNLVQLHSSTSDQTLGTSSPDAVVSDIFSLDMNTRVELPELEATPYHSASSIDLSVNVLEHREAVAFKKKEGQLNSASNSQAIVQPKMPSLDEALLAALSAFSASKQSACIQESVDGSFETSGECEQHEAFASDEFDTCDPYNIGTSDANSESLLAACQTTKLQNQSLCEGFSIYAASQKAQVLELEEVPEMKITPEAVSDSNTSSEMEKANDSKEDADIGTITDSSSVIVHDLFSIAPKAEIQARISKEAYEHDTQCLDADMQNDQILNTACHTDIKSEGILGDLISWDNQTSFDFIGSSAVSLKEITMTYLDYADNTSCVISEGVREEVDFHTCRFPVSSTMQYQVAAAGSLSELTATSSDSVTGGETGKDVNSLDVGLFTLKPVHSVNKTDDTTSDMLEEFFACNITIPMDIEDGARTLDQEGTFSSFTGTPYFSGVGRSLMLQHANGEVEHGIIDSLTSLETVSSEQEKS